MRADLAAPRVSVPALGRAVMAVLAVTVLAVTGARMDWAGLRDTIRSADWAPLMGAVAVNVPVTLARAARTRSLLGHLGRHVGFVRLCTTQLIGQALSGLTPAASGDLSRSVLWRTDGVPVSSGVAVVVVERVASLELLVAVGAVCIAPWAGGPAVAAAVAAAGVAVLVASWAAGTTAVAMSRRPASTARVQRWRSRLSRFAAARDDLAALARWRVGALAFTAWTVAIFVMSGVQLCLVADAIHTSLPLLGAVAMYALSQAAGSLSALPFGIGTADAAVVGIAARLGRSVADGGAIALLSRLTLTVPVTLAAGVLLGAHAVLGDREEEAPAHESVPGVGASSKRVGQRP